MAIFSLILDLSLFEPADSILVNRDDRKWFGLRDAIEESLDVALDLRKPGRKTLQVVEDDDVAIVRLSLQELEHRDHAGRCMKSPPPDTSSWKTASTS